MKKSLVFLCLVSSFISYGQVNLTQGLIGDFRLDGDATDQSGNNLNGVINNAVPTSDRNGNANKAYYFNGMDAYIELPYSNLYNFGPQDSLSISIWVLPDQNYSWPAQAIIVKSPPNADYTVSFWNYGVYLFNYKAMGGYAYNNIVVGSTVFTGNTCWYNIIMTYKNGFWKLYVNGVLEANDQTQSHYILQDGSSKIDLGKKGESFGDWYKGKMDDVRLYNRVLTPDEIRVLAAPTIDSVTITKLATNCNSFDFSGLAFPNNAPVTSWEWNFGDNTTAAVQNTSHAYSANAGNSYPVKLVVSDNIGCRDSIIAAVTTANLPLVKTNNDTSVCSGSRIQLNTKGATSYSWVPTTGLSNSAIADPMVAPNVTTRYIVTGTNGEACAANDTVYITVNQIPSISISTDTVICINSSIQLMASGGISYQWSPATSLNDASIFDPAADPKSTTVYHVIVTDNKSCSNEDSVEVSVKTKRELEITPETNICGPNQVQLSAGGGDIYLWEPAASLSNPNISNPVATLDNTTTYSVVVTDTVCMQDSTLSVSVTVFPLPSVSAAKSTDLDCSHATSQLTATGAEFYTWSPQNTISNPDIPNPVASPAIPTLYIVKGVDMNGCINYDSILVNISVANEGLDLMPSAFSPNNDGLNDCYGLKFWGALQKLDFGIYNRWGQLIFHTSNPNDCWDGTFFGKPQNAGVYVYLIRASSLCGDIFRKGTFTLIR